MEKLSVINVQSAYGKHKVLTGINLSAEAGQCIGLVGANGCGKSTLLNILAGLRKQDGGEIYLDGQLAEKKQQFIRYIGYVPQQSNLIEEVTVWDNLLLAYGDERTLKEQLENGFLKFLGLQEMCDLKAGRLSGGMKKRVSIGCAMAGNPSILLLDEPGAALDLPGKGEVHKYLEFYKKQGGIIVIATHEESDLDLCDKIYVLNEGRSREIERTVRGEALIEMIRSNGAVTELTEIKKNKPQKKKNKKRSLLGGILVIVLLILLSFAGILIYEARKTPKERFIKGMQTLMEENENIIPWQSEPVRLSANINLTIPGQFTLGLDMLWDMDYANKLSNTNIRTSVYNIPLLAGDITHKDSMWYMTLDDVLEEAYAIDGSTLGRDYNASRWASSYFDLSLPEDYVWNGFWQMPDSGEWLETFSGQVGNELADIVEGMDVEVTKEEVISEELEAKEYLQVVLYKEDVNAFIEKAAACYEVTDVYIPCFTEDIELLVALDKNDRILAIRCAQTVALSMQTEDAVGFHLKWKVTETMADEQMTFDVGKLVLYEGDEELFKLTGDVSFAPFQGEIRVPETSVNLFDLEKSEIEDLLTEIVDGIYRKVFR